MRDAEKVTGAGVSGAGVTGASTPYEFGALILQRTDYGEADLIVMLFTDMLGRMSALARGARKSRHRFAGSLETFCTLRITVEPPRSSELFTLRAARLERPRLSLLTEVAALGVGGEALRWLRKALPPRAPDPAIWARINAYLDQLDASPPAGAARADASLGEFGLALLADLGWGLELMRCVSCGRLCPETSSARIEPRRGGLVCHRCGMGSFLVDAALRRSIAVAATGVSGVVADGDGSRVRSLVESTLLVHAGIEK